MNKVFSKSGLFQLIIDLIMDKLIIGTKILTLQFIERPPYNESLEPHNNSYSYKSMHLP
jgi:hypothetical protein